MNTYLQIIITIVLSLFVSLASAETWRLDAAQSSVSYLSSKLVADSLSAIFEPNHFEKFTGSISQGEMSVTIDLDSVKTGVVIRDERVREFVFKTQRYPQAMIKMKMPKLRSLPAKTTGTAAAHLSVHTAEVAVTMRGKTHSMPVKLRIDQFRQKNGSKVLIAQSISPVLVNANTYGMTDGFRKLRELVKLFNIPTTIPVSFSLVFVEKG